MAQRLGVMELMVLLLQYSLIRCTVLVFYLSSASSELRPRSVKPIHLLLSQRNDNGNGDDGNCKELPYWDDAIDKYFDQPDHESFHIQITFAIILSVPDGLVNDLNNFMLKTARIK